MPASRDPEFRTVRMREGYDLDAVDDFVDRVIDALEGRPGGRELSPDQIENEEFKVVRMREGYVMDDVDDWLDAAAADLRAVRRAQAANQGYEPAPAARTDYSPPPAPMPPTVAPAAYPSVAAPSAPVYPGYQDPGYQDTGFQNTGFQDTGYQDTSTGTHAFDPLTDSAVHEIDPALRALDPGYGQAAQHPYESPGVPDPRPDDQSLSNAATPSTGLHHLEIWARDLENATHSFGWLFERLGWTLFQVWDNGRSWQSPGGGPYIVVERSPDLTWVAYDRKAPGMNHLALAVPERWMVDRIVSEAPTYGWRLMFADRHPHAGGPNHYAAYMENDEGFEVEVVAP